MTEQQVRLLNASIDSIYDRIAQQPASNENDNLLALAQIVADLAVFVRGHESKHLTGVG